MNPHDRAYKQLFQNKKLLELLFTPEILGAEWGDLLDFNQEKLPPAGSELRAKHKPLPHNNLAALLFLLEHNSDYHEAQVLLRELDQQSASYHKLRRAIISGCAM